MKLQNINFKKVFIIFFAAFLVFTAVSFVYAASSGQWSEAVHFEQSRIEARNSSAISELGSTRRHFSHSNQERVTLVNESDATQADTGSASDEVTVPVRAPGSRLMRSAARTYVRVTSADFGVFQMFRLLFHAVLTMLLALWVFVDSKKHGRNTILWTAITAVTSVFGFGVYLLVHKVRKAPAAEA